jgi:hypothetical protein
MKDNDRAPLRATFEAFAYRPGHVLLGASATYLLLLLVLGGVFAVWNWPRLEVVGPWAADMLAAAVDRTATLSFRPPPPEYGAMAPSWVAVMAVHYVLLAAYETACLRWMIREEAPGMFGIYLDADTWRVYAGYWVWSVLMLGGFVLMNFFAFAAALASGLFGTGGLGGPAALFIFPVVAALCVIGALSFSVRLGPASATTVALGRFAFFSAWKVSRGRYWALFGSYLSLTLLYALSVMASFGIAALAWVLALKFGWQAHIAVQVLAVFGPFHVATTAIGLTCAVLYWGVNARAVKAALDEGKISASTRATD